MEMVHILVCGGRHFTDYPLLCSVLDSSIGNMCDMEIVSGHCQGAERLGEIYAEEHGFSVKMFPAEWEKYQRKAGPIRNRQMIDYIKPFANRFVVAFTSENTVGTRYTMSLAKKAGIPVMEIPYVPDTKMWKRDKNKNEHTMYAAKYVFSENPHVFLYL